MELWMWLVAGLIGGFALGYGFSLYLRSKSFAGTLREDHSDPTEAPYLFLELEPGGLEKIQRSKTVMFRVVIRDYITRK